MIAFQFFGSIILSMGLFFCTLYFYFWPQLWEKPELRRSKNFTLLAVLAFFICTFAGGLIAKALFTNVERAYPLETRNDRQGSD